MAAEHETVETLAMLELSKRGARVFKNAMGMGFAGQVTEEYPSSAGQIVTLKGARRVRYGVQNPGGSDLIGWRPLVITPEMVGLTVAQFVACECKTKSYNTASKEQKTFLAAVSRSGGVAIIARREGDGVGFEDVEE
jgi:hypothetical protein